MQHYCICRKCFLWTSSVSKTLYNTASVSVETNSDTEVASPWSLGEAKHDSGLADTANVNKDYTSSHSCFPAPRVPCRPRVQIFHRIYTKLDIRSWSRLRQLFHLHGRQHWLCRAIVGLNYGNDLASCPTVVVIDDDMIDANYILSVENNKLQHSRATPVRLVRA